MPCSTAWIDEAVYLTGVTMDQVKVLEADEKLRRLANAAGLLPRGRIPYGQAIRQVEATDGPLS